MPNDKNQPKPKKPAKPKPEPPDGRGDRPTDPNEFAKWLLEQTIDKDNTEERESD